MPAKNDYFILTRIGIWSARLPVGHGWRLYANDPIMGRLGKRWLGSPAVLFSTTAILAFFFGVAVVMLPTWAQVGAFIIAGLAWSIPATLEATFLMIEEGIDGKELGRLTPARKLFLKTQTVRMCYLTSGCGLLGAVVGKSFS